MCYTNCVILCHRYNNTYIRNVDINIEIPINRQTALEERYTPIKTPAFKI